MDLALIRAVNLNFRNLLSAVVFGTLVFGLVGPATAKELAFKNEAHRLMVLWETKHNPLGETSGTPVILETLLIPVHLLDVSDLLKIPAQIRRSLLVRIDGKSYFRWIFHPDDTFYRNEVITDISKLMDLPPDAIPKTEHYLIGYRTASRSLLVMDPRSKYVFSMKTSSNSAGGGKDDRPQPVRYARSSILATAHIRVMEARYGKFEFAVPLYEPGAVYNHHIDQAQIFRTLPEMNGGDKIYMPMFSMLSAEVMEKLSKANQMDMSQVLEHIGYIWGRAQTEWVLKTGLSTSSAHSQNYMIELDQNLRFTGRVQFRDFADAHVMESFLEGPFREEILQHWTNLEDPGNMIFKRSLSLSFMPYHSLFAEIETPQLLGIFDGIRAGVKSYLGREIGAWALQKWQMDESTLTGKTGILMVGRPQPSVDIELVLELIRRRSGGAKSCRFIHGQF